MNFNNNNNPNFPNKPVRAFPQNNYPNQKPQHHNNFGQNFQYSSHTPGQNPNRYHNIDTTRSYKYSNNIPINMGNPVDMGTKQRMRNTHVTPDRIENENPAQNDYRFNDPFRRYRCHTHHNEPLIKICTHPVCINGALMCENCVTTHNPDHRDSIRSADEFLDEIIATFQTHSQVSNEFEIVPEDLIRFIRGEDEAIRRYSDNVGLQKRIVEEQFRVLMEGFREMCNNKVEELKKAFDFNLEIFASNYTYFSQKLRNFYEYAGVDAVVTEAYQNKDNILAHFRKFKNLTETSACVKELKALFQNVKNFQTKVMTEKKVPKRDIEEEIVNEVKKYIKKIYQQVAAPITLESRPLPMEPSDPFNKNKMKTNMNFYEAYNTLAKQIEKSFETFQASLSQTPLNEDLTKTSFFTVFEDNILPQQASGQSLLEAAANQVQKRNSFQPNSSLIQKTSTDLEIDIDNYFDFNAMQKILHYFEPGTNNMFILDLRNISSCQFKPDSKEVNLEHITLDINFPIPYNNCSIITPDGRLFLCGGCEEGEVYNSLYEYNPQNHTLIRRKSMLSKRCNHGICMVNKDYIMVAGGFFSTEVGSLDTCEMYNIKKDTWSYISPLHKKSERHSLCNFNEEYVYKLGGINDYVIERYSIRDNTWEVILMERTVEIGHNCESIQINSEQILIFGGHYRGNLDQCAVMSVQTGGNFMQESIVCCDDLALPEKLYFHCPKSAVIVGDAVYALDYGKQKVVRFSNGKWKCLN